MSATPAESDNTLSNNNFLVQSVSEAETRVMRRNAARFLELPLGQMTEASMWYDAEATLKWWVSQRTPESLETSLKLLERLVAETQCNKAAEAHLDVSLEWSVMESLLNHWRHLCKTTTHQPLLDIWTPTYLLKTLDRWAATAPRVRGLQIGGGALFYILQGVLLRYEPRRAAVVADELLQQAPTLKSRHRITTPLINAVLHAWSQSGRSDAVQRAEDLFFAHTQRDLVTYNVLLDCYAKAGKAESAESLLLAMAQDWLEQQNQQQQPQQQPHPGHKGRHSHIAIRPDRVSFGTTAAAWAQSGDPEAPERISFLLKRMLDPMHPFGQLQIPPDTRFFNNILSCWAKSNRHDAAEQAYGLLCEMTASFQERRGPNHHYHREERGYVEYEMEEVEEDESAIPADSFSFGICVNAFAKQGNAKKAAEVAQELVNLYKQTHEESLRPTIPIFSSVMDAWIRSSNNNDAQEKVQHMIQEIDELHRQGVLLQGADTWIYNQLLSVIVSKNNGDPLQRAQQADDLLQWMKENVSENARPNGWSYTTVICAWLEVANKEEGADRAEQLLQECFENPNVSLGLKTPARVIHILAKTRRTTAADLWLRRTYDAFEESAFGEEKPSRSLLGAVVASWFRVSSSAQHKDHAGFRAEELVQRATNLYERGLLSEEPDARTLHHLILSLAKTRDLDAAHRANDILQRLRCRSSTEGKNELIPPKQLFGALIQAFSDLRRPDLAENLLMEMLDDFQRGKRQAHPPDVESFNNAMMGWTHHSDPSEALTRVDALLARMRNLAKSKGLPLWPNRRSYHFAMDICDRIPFSAERLRRYFEKMRETCQPSGLAYRFVIRALHQQGRVRDAEAYLRDACMQHQMGFLPAAPPKKWFEELEDAKRKQRSEKRRRRSLNTQSSTSTKQQHDCGDARGVAS